MTKTMKDFIGLHTGSNIIVCGCGQSARSFIPYKDDFISIGVNDIGRLLWPTYLLITDHPTRFQGIRKDVVMRGEYKYMFTCMKMWKIKPPHKKVMYTLGKKGSLHNLDNDEKIDHYLNSPYSAAILAYKMGAKNIGFIGVDFTHGHFYSPKDGAHPLVRMGKLKDLNEHYDLLQQRLMEKGIGMYNLSNASQIKVFQNMSFEDFKKL